MLVGAALVCFADSVTNGLRLWQSMCSSQQMPRNYIKKKVSTYDQVDVQNAVEQVLAGASPGSSTSSNSCIVMPGRIMKTFQGLINCHSFLSSESFFLHDFFLSLFYLHILLNYSIYTVHYSIFIVIFTCFILCIVL
ncbi:hypothetical protein M8J75_000870 [Diaphorina citri]|nr:hypothetical protein M8J75_000870 [Diaphorina citri]